MARSKQRKYSIDELVELTGLPEIKTAHDSQELGQKYILWKYHQGGSLEEERGARVVCYRTSAPKIKSISDYFFSIVTPEFWQPSLHLKIEELTHVRGTSHSSFFPSYSMIFNEGAGGQFSVFSYNSKPFETVEDFFSFLKKRDDWFAQNAEFGIIKDPEKLEL